MPGEIQFLENFYETQSLDVRKLANSSYNDAYPAETVFSFLPKLIEYYVARWENLNLVHTFNKEFYDSNKQRIDEFRATPKDLLKKIHSERGRLFRKAK